MAHRSIARAVIAASGAQAVAQIVILLIRLAEIPLLIYFWGGNLYGQWLVLSAVPAYLAFSDFGFITSINRFLVIPVTQGDLPLATKVFQTSFFLALFLSAFFSTLFAGAFVLFPIGEIFNVTAVGQMICAQIVALLCIRVVVSMQGQVLFGGYMAIRKYPLGLILLSANQLLEFVAMAIAVACGAGFRGAAIAMLSGQAVGVLVMFIWLKRRSPWMKLGWRSVDVALLRQFWSPAMASLTFPVGDAISFQGIRLIIAHLLGPVALVSFVAHRQIARLLTQAATGARIFEAEIAYAYAAENHDLLKRINHRLFQSILWVSVVLFLGLLFAVPFAFPYWTAGKIPFESPLFLTLLIASLFECLWRVVVHPLLMTNQHTFVSGNIFIVRCVFIALAYFICSGFGLVALSLTITFCELVILVLVIRSHLKIFGDSLGVIFAVVRTPPLGLVLRAYREVFK